MKDAELYYEFVPEPDTREEHALTVREWLFRLEDDFFERHSRGVESTDFLLNAIDWIETWLLPLPMSGRWAKV